MLSGAPLLLRAATALSQADYFEAAVDPLLAETKVHYVDVSDLPCIEIDFLEDLDKAAELATSDLFKDQR